MILTATQVVSVRPIVLSAPDRGADLQLRISAPASGDDLPIVLFSHGFGWSMDGYGPLVDHWAAGGFAVLQPTHLDSSTLDVGPDDARAPGIWRHRIADLTRILDDLEEIEAAVPGLRGRLDHERIAATGHSYGATTASALLGARVRGHDEDFADPRVAAGVLLAVAGHGGNDLTPFAAEHFPFMNPDFAAMRAPALVVAGDQDRSLLSTRGPDWWTDAYHDAPGAEALLTLHGAEHSLGGIPAYVSAHELGDSESPELVALVQQVTTAYLRKTLGRGDWAPVDSDLATLEIK